MGDFPVHLVLGVISAVAGVIVFASREWRSRSAQGWPVAEGIVELHATGETWDTGRRREVLEVGYSYQVDGRFYSGAHRVNRESDYGAFPMHSRLLVHYNPVDPAKCFLDREDVRRRMELAKADRMLSR